MRRASSSPLRLHGLIAHALLALFVLLAQQHAFAHRLGHAVEATHAAAKSAVPAPHCDACDALAALADAIDGPAPARSLAADAAPALPVTTAIAAIGARPLHAYQSRAPPRG